MINDKVFATPPSKGGVEFRVETVDGEADRPPHRQGRAQEAAHADQGEGRCHQSDARVHEDRGGERQAGAEEATERHVKHPARSEHQGGAASVLMNLAFVLG